MKKSHAAGRKTDNTLGLLGTHLDHQLDRLTQALGQCLDEAGAVPRDQDQYGRHRAGEIAHAVTIAKTSAKLIASLAKLDREFRHTISVSHGERPAPKRKAPTPPRVEYLYPDPEIAATMTEDEIIAYSRRHRGTPPPNSEGSNG